VAKPRNPLPPAALPSTFTGRLPTFSPEQRAAQEAAEARAALIAAALRALEALAASSASNRERERLATFRRYIESLGNRSPVAEEERKAKSEGRRIGRKAFAALVGVSPKTLLDWHAAGTFEPAYLDPKGWRFYAFEQVAEAKALLRKRRR
jgi:hypothetical protein